jgi:hypothetical protein
MLKRLRGDWFDIRPRPDYLDHSEPTWFKSLHGVVVCAECWHVLPEKVGEAVDARLLEKPDPRPFSSIFPWL